MYSPSCSKVLMLLLYASRIVSFLVMVVFSPPSEPRPPPAPPPEPPEPLGLLPLLPVSSSGALIFNSSILCVMVLSFFAFSTALPRLSDKSPALPAASFVPEDISPISSVRPEPPVLTSNFHPKICPSAFNTVSVKEITFAITVFKVCKNGLNAAINPVPITVANFFICS